MAEVAWAVGREVTPRGFHPAPRQAAPPGAGPGRLATLIAVAAMAWPLGPTAALEAFELGREEAVMLALERDEEVARAAQRAEVRRGVVGDLEGAFDARFDFTLSYQRSQGQLVRAQREFEDDRRDVHRVIIDEFTLINEDLERQLARTDSRPIPDCRDLILVVDGTEVCLSDFQASNARTFQEFLATVIDQQDAPAEREVLELILQQQLDNLRMTLANVVIDLRNQIANSEVALENLGVIPDIQKRYTLQFDLRLRKLLRNGIELSAGTILDSVEDNFDGKSLRASLGGKGIPNAFITFVGFEVVAPLRKGFGAKVSQAPVRAAQLNARAALEQWLHRANESALAAALGYWNLVASDERTGLLERAVALDRELLEIARALVEGDEIPRSDLALVRARLASAQQRLSEARDALLVSRLDLAETLGLEVLSLGQAPTATESLPAGFSPAEASRLKSLVESTEVSPHRYDVAAADKRREAAEILVDGAKRNLRRRLDLDFAVGYTGLFESFEKEIYNLDGFRRSFKSKQSGPTGLLRLSFDLPRRNRIARAQSQQAESLSRQGEIIATDLRRQVELRLAQVTSSLEVAARELERRELALEQWEATLQAARERFRAGEESVVDMILTEEELTSARLARVAARSLLARLLEQLRFELGGLVTEGFETGQLSLEDPLKRFEQSQGPVSGSWEQLAEGKGAPKRHGSR